MTTKALIIGYGSIGERHARILESLGFAVTVVSRRELSGNRPTFSTITAALRDGSYSHAVIANETGLHAQSLTELAECGFSGTLLVEKPLFSSTGNLPPLLSFERIRVGYNLRFHPAVKKLRASLKDDHAEIADFHVGQWLADWRPNRPAASTYSASSTFGGGVLRDLSHELDLAISLFGPWKRVAAIGGRLSNITKDADDGWGILLSCERCKVVTIHMNCLDRRGRRTITVQSGARTFRCDLIGHTFDDGSFSQTFPLARDDTYAEMHSALIKNAPEGCNFEEGLETVKLIEAIEKAAQNQCWVNRE